MCLTEYNETETMEMFRAEGEDKLARLIITLNEEGEAELVTKALQDI